VNTRRETKTVAFRGGIFIMKKTGFFAWGMLILMLAGCSSLSSLSLATGQNAQLGNTTTIGESTSVIIPEGGGKWASALSAQVSSEAKKQATYRKTEQYYEWPFLCYDYQMNQAELSRGLQSGVYRTGKAYRSASDIGARSSGISGNNVNNPIEHGTIYYAIHVKTPATRTVDAVDQAKYDALYSAILKEKTAALQQRYNGFKSVARDVSDYETFIYSNGGKIEGKNIKSILEQQLAGYPPGTVLFHGGIFTTWLIRAEMVDGVLQCQVAE
jgi:hypothetical protein